MTENKLLGVLQSRKFWSAVIGLAAILWTAYQSGGGVDPDTLVNAILGIVAAYIAATAYEDSQHAKAQATVTAAAMTAPAAPAVGIDANTVEVSAPDDRPVIGRMGMK